MDDRVRVLTVVSGLAIGEPLGGAERFGIELANSLDRTSFEPLVCALWRRRVPSETHWERYLAEADVEVFYAADWPDHADPPRYIQGLAAVARRFRDARVDIIHSHLPLASLATVFLKRPLGVKVLVRTAHAGKEWGDGAIAFAARQVFTKWVYPFTLDAEACVSQAQVDAFDRRPGARLLGRKAHLLHNAIRLDRFQKEPDPELVRARRAEIGLAPGDQVVGSVGRLRQEKGYAILVEAAQQVRARATDVKFVVVGHGPLWAELHRHVDRLGLHGVFIFTGARSDVDHFYRMMDVFVLPSFWEGLPTVILESMASGVPVVATDIPGTRELVTHGQTGWLVRAGNPTSLADGILSALQAPAARARVALNALTEVTPRFSLDSIARQYERLYLELLGR